MAFLGQLAPRGIGSALGQGLGTGLGSGLQALAEQKLRDLAQRTQKSQTASGLQALEQAIPGFKYTPGLENLPEQLLSPYLKSELARPGEESYAQMINTLLGGQQPQPAEGMEGQPAQPEGSAPQIPGRLTEKQATTLAKLTGQKEQQALKEKSIGLKEQAAIEKKNAPFVKGLQEDIRIAKQIHFISNKMKELWETGDVASGVRGRLPNLIQNATTQEFDALSNELAVLLASTGKGVATNFKIRMAQLSKPHITQKREAQKKLLDNLTEKIKPILSYEKAFEEVMSGHEKEPSNLETLVKKTAHKYKNPVELGSTFDSIEDFIERATEGDEVTDDMGITYVKQGNQVVPKGT